MLYPSIIKGSAAMKNIIVLIEPEEIKAYVAKLWKTDEFKNSPFVQKMVDQFAETPKFFFEMSDASLETSHFSAWWGGISHRTYDNPAISDLYYLHEMTHAATMPYMKDMAFGSFSQKMNENELVASVTSEIQVYFEIPGFRAKTFGQEIYADRFLKDPAYQFNWTASPQRTLADLALHRRDVMHNSNPKDTIEYWISRYFQQNACWNSIWFDRYNEVETAMADLHRDCSTMGRKGAMDKFMTWLQSDAISQGTGIPFPDEAKVFAGHYWKNKKVYEAAVEREKEAKSVKSSKPAAFRPK